MLMFTAEDYEKQNEVIRALERHKVAELLRTRADAHPKWEVHDLLVNLAREIENAGKTD